MVFLETRNLKLEGRKKSEARNANRGNPTTKHARRISSFGLPSDFGFRVSDLNFRQASNADARQLPSPRYLRRKFMNHRSRASIRCLASASIAVLLASPACVTAQRNTARQETSA